MIFVSRYGVGGGLNGENGYLLKCVRVAMITPFSLSKMLLQEKTTFPRGKSLKYILHLSEKKQEFPKNPKKIPKIPKKSQRKSNESEKSPKET